MPRNRNTVRRKPIARNSGVGYGTIPANATVVLDKFDLEAMKEGIAMKKIPSWRSKPHATNNVN